MASHSVSRDFVVDNAILQQFKDFLKDNQVDSTDADIAANLDGSSPTSRQSSSPPSSASSRASRSAPSPTRGRQGHLLPPEAMALVDRDKEPQKTASLLH